MKRVFTIAAYFLICVGSLYAQDNFRQKYEEFRKQSIQTYSDFRKECNDRYVEFMRLSWDYYKAGPACPKPREKWVPPIEIDDRPKIKEREIVISEIIPIHEPAPRPQPVAPVIEKPVPAPEFSFNYFGTTISIRADESSRFHVKSTLEDDVADIWALLSSGEYDNMLYDCLKARDDYQLCDWAYLLMLFSFSDKFLGGGNDSMLLTCYLFCQSGYKMRMGLAKSGISLLFGTKFQIYDAPCYTIDGEYFYQFNGQDGEMNIVNCPFPNEKPLSLAMNSIPRLTVINSDSRSLKAKKYGTSASCSVNTNLIKFFSLYPSAQFDGNPLTRWALYADTPLDPAVREKLYPSLEKAIDGKTKAEAADILLNFVQTAFKYEYDDKVWGRDRAFFSEETLYYPESDCEDRSILYSRLVRDLLELDVILVYYPGHLATAVKLPEAVAGDYIVMDSGRYLVCDPTYIGAPIGVTMPGMDNNEARAILLN